MARNIKFGYLFSSLEWAEHFWDQNGADLVKFSVLQQNRIVYNNSIEGTLLSISSNGLDNKTVISCLLYSIVKLLPLRTVDDLMQ